MTLKVLYRLSGLRRLFNGILSGARGFRGGPLVAHEGLYSLSGSCSKVSE